MTTGTARLICLGTTRTTSLACLRLTAGTTSLLLIISGAVSLNCLLVATRMNSARLLIYRTMSLNRLLAGKVSLLCVSVMLGLTLLVVNIGTVSLIVRMHVFRLLAYGMGLQLGAAVFKIRLMILDVRVMGLFRLLVEVRVLCLLNLRTGSLIRLVIVGFRTVTLILGVKILLLRCKLLRCRLGCRRLLLRLRSLLRSGFVGGLIGEHLIDLGALED